MTVSQKVTLFRESSWFEPFSSEKNPFVMPAIFWNSESLLTKKDRLISREFILMLNGMSLDHTC